MKQSKRIISVLLAVVMLLTVVPVQVFAAHANYDKPGGYDILDNPFVTPAQAASMILDMLDEMLAEEDMTFEVDIVVGKKTIDLRSIDRATSSIDSFWNWTWIDIAFALLNFGDLEKLNMNWIENCPKRTQSGKTDLDVVIALCAFLADNHDRIGKIVDDSFNWGFVETVTDLPEVIHDLPGTLKAAVLKPLNDGVDPPAGTTVDSLIQKLIDGLLAGEPDPETGVYDGILPSMLGKTSIGTGSTAYDFLTDAINAGVSDLLVPLLSGLLIKLAGVEITPEFPGGNFDDAPNFGMVIGIVAEIAGEVPYTPEDLLTPMSQMNAALNYMFLEGGLDVYFYLDDTGLHVEAALIDLIDGLVRVGLALIPGLDFLKNTSDFATEEEITAMTMPECYAYLARLLINDFVDFADIPDTATTVRSVVTYLLIGLAKDVLPEMDFETMIRIGTLNPFTDGVFVVGAVLGRYYLNGLLPIDIPAGLNFEQTLSVVFDWFISEYGGLFDTSTFLPTDSVWQKIDKIIFKIIPVNWLPAAFTGSEYLLMDWLLGNILDFDYVGLLGIVKRNPTSELNMSITTVLLNTVSRALAMFIGGNTILPMNLTTFDSIFTKVNLRSTIQNLCRYLYPNSNALLGTLFPLLAQVMGIWSKDTYVRKPPAGAPLVSIQALQNLLDAYTPRNLNEELEYDQPGYHFFGAEDFAELRNYFNYKQAKTEVQDLLDAYAEDPETLDLQMNTEAAYRVTFYFNRLQKKAKLSATQLTNELIKAYDLNLVESEYTATTWAAYQRALTFAEKVRVDSIISVPINFPAIRQSTVSAARQNLFKSIKGLKDFIPFADYTQLDMFIKDAKQRLANLPPDIFSPESIQNLEEALVMAEGLDRLIHYADQYLVDEAAAQLYTAIYGLNYSMSPAITPILNASHDYWGNPITPVVDVARKYIYGLTKGGFNEDFFETVGGASLTVFPTPHGNGTSTRVRLLNSSGNPVANYQVIVYGDVNGDGNIDDGDSGMIIDYANFLYDWRRYAEKTAAADVNGDGNVDAIDAGITTDCLNYLKTIDQITGTSMPIVQ